MAAPKYINIPLARERLSYDPSTGLLRWKCNRTGKAKRKAIAGYLTHKGYISVSIDGEAFFAHRLAWAIEKGEQPPPCVDHINGDKRDNRLSNLRGATTSENTHNSRWGKGDFPRGVSWHKRLEKFIAYITIDKSRKHLGYFSSVADAEKAVAHARQKHLPRIFAKVQNTAPASR